MRQKKVEGEYQGDSWSRPNGRRPWSKPIPPRTTRCCDGPRVPDRSMVGTWYTPLHDPSFAKRARIVPQRTNNGVHMRGIAQVLGRLRDDLVVRRPWGLGCQIQRHRGSGRCALDIPLNRRISRPLDPSTWWIGRVQTLDQGARRSFSFACAKAHAPFRMTVL